MPREFQDGDERSVHLARVIQYHAGLNYYRVVLLAGGPHRKAVAGGTPSAFGAVDHRAYPAGSVVVVLDTMGTGGSVTRAPCLDIIGSITGSTVDQSVMQSDFSDLMCGAGHLFDKIHSFLSHERTAEIAPPAAGGGVPMDAIGGENGVFSPLGPAWLISLAMAYMRASDRCGIWMFRLDEHLRMVAKSLEQQTMAREVLDLYDDGELSVIERIAFVPWEALGSFHNGIPTGVRSASEFDDPTNAPTEQMIKTVEVDQKAIFRQFSLKGYLGDIHDEFVALPVEATGLDSYSGGLSLLGDEVMQGVFRQITGADGAFVLQSAKGIHLEKYPLIQLPIETAPYDDPAGDTPENYKASGTFGKGEAQKREDFQPADNGCPGDRGILGLALHGAYISKASLQTLRAHKKDWRVQDESATPLAAQLGKGTYVSPGGFKVDATKMWMDLPTHVDLDVQKGRWEKVRYYAGRSAIDMWDDGSVVIEDAWGSQIIMAGGNIVLTCPGDIIMAPGRSCVTMAPQDIVQRAGNSVDITASKRDVTIKAEVNLKMLGGNAKTKGGVLVESLASEGPFDFKQDGEKTNISGLILRSFGTAAVVAEKLSLIGYQELGLQTFALSGVMETAYLEVAQGLNIAAGPATDPLKVVYSFGAATCLLGTGGSPTIVLGGMTTVQGDLALKGSVACGGAVSAVGVGAFGGGVAAPGGSVSDLSTQGAKQIRTGVDTLMRTIGSVVTGATAALASVHAQLRALITAGGSYFNGVEVAAAVSCSLRTAKDYRTDQPSGFVLTQWRWQAYMNGSGSTWSEPGVGSFAGTTYPWPGEAWTNGNGYLVYDLKVFDAAKGMSTDGGVQLAPELTSRGAPQSLYLVNSTET